MKLLLGALVAFPLAALASPSGVVISGFQLRGPAGGNDEYVELRNNSAANVDVSGWRLQGCAAGTPGNASNRATVGANVILTPGQYYLFTNNGSGGYSGAVPGDATYGTGVTDFADNNFAGIQLLDAAGVRQDGVGSPSSPCREGKGFATPTGTPANNASNAFARTQDTDDNVSDFAGPQATNPHASGGITVTCLNDNVRIYAIQGAGHVSPYASKCVTNVPGLVTQLVGNGFFMQDPDGDGDPATSDGIFVFTSTAPAVLVGQQVKVKGNVSEFRSGTANLAITEITAPTVTPASGLFTATSVTPVVIGNGGRVPPNRIIDNDTAGSVEVAAQTTYDPAQDAIDFYESLEGMQVQVNNGRVVGPLNGFGEIWLVGDNGANATGSNARGGITLTESGGAVDFNPERIQVDLSELVATHPFIHVRDTTPQVAGALTYAFGNYRVMPSTLPTFASGGLARATSTVATGIERLRIASYNVENLDANDGDSCDGGPDRDIADGRFVTAARQIVGALGSPDIVGLEEIQDNSGCMNDGTVDASATLSLLVQAIAAEGGPAYQYLQVIPANNADGGAPGANIRQAILYNPARVTHVAGTAGAGDATTATAASLDAGNLRLSHSPGRIEPANGAWANSRKPLAATFDFNGRRVLVIVNHFNSKGGDDPLMGRFQPPFLDTEAQRLQQAQVQHAFIAQALALDPGARIVTLGDFNDFEFSAPIRTLTGEASGSQVLHGLASRLLAPEERYSYIFEGNSQELDHIFVTSALLADAQFQAVHVNAEFADQVSDHDPLIASFRLLPTMPVANAGADVSVTHLTQVTLSASGSSAGDGSALTYQWTQVAGWPVEMTGANAATLTFRAPAQPFGLAFRLTVTDRFGQSASDDVAVEVRPGRPGN